MDHIDRAEAEPPRVGTTVTSHTAAPAGTWELIGHPGCDLLGRLRALTSGETAPLCPACGAVVRWRMTHPAPNGADGDGGHHATWQAGPTAGHPLQERGLPMASDDRSRTDDEAGDAGQPEGDDRSGGAGEAAGGLRATVQASNAEAVLDPDAPPQDAEEEAADTVDRMERHNEPHDGAPPEPD